MLLLVRDGRSFGFGFERDQISGRLCWRGCACLLSCCRSQVKEGKLRFITGLVLRFGGSLFEVMIRECRLFWVVKDLLQRHGLHRDRSPYVYAVVN